MTYGKHISQVSRTERKLYPQREPTARPAKKYIRTQAEIDLCYSLFGYDPVEEQAKADDWRDEQEMYSDLRHGG